MTFESLAKTFAAVATELGTGHEVCLVKGDLVDALRASYALPGIFEPRFLGGKWLFDGAMANPVPVSVCRALGANMVIAVNLTADFGPTALPDTDITTDPSVAELDDLAASLAAQHAIPRRIRLRRFFARRRLFGGRHRGPGIASVMVGAFSIAQERISRFRMALDPPDAMVNARMTSVGLFDFHRAAELIEHGRQAARVAMPEIEAKLGHSQRRTPVS